MSEYSLTLAFDNKNIRAAGDDLEAMLTEAGANPFGTVKRRTPCFIPGHFEGGERRLAKMISASAIVLDVDNETGLAGFERAVAAGLRAYCWTTWSHRPEKPRYRLVLPTDKSFPIEIYRPLAMAAAERLGIDADPNALDACRASVLPTATHSTKRHFMFWKNEGNRRLSASHEGGSEGRSTAHSARAARDLDPDARAARRRSSAGLCTRQVRGDRRSGDAGGDGCAVRAHESSGCVGSDAGRHAHDCRRSRVLQDPDNGVQQTDRRDDGHFADDQLLRSGAGAAKKHNARRSAAAPAASSTEELIYALIGRLILLFRRGQLIGHRNAVACEIGAALGREGLDPESATRIAESAIRTALEFAPQLGIHLDLDMDDAGNAEASWGRRVRASAWKAADGCAVRGFGSLFARDKKLAQIIRAIAEHERLSMAERPTLCGEDAAVTIREALAGDAPIKVVAVTTGAGKSRALRERFAASPDRTIFSMPMHALVEQTQRALNAEHGVEAPLPARSLLALRRPDESLMCREPQRVRLAMYAGKRARDACAVCAHAKECAPLIAAARADEVRGDEAHGAGLRTHATLPADLAATIARGAAPITELLLDECPPIYQHGDWGDFRSDNAAIRMLTEDGRILLEDGVARIERGLDVGAAARAAAERDGPLVVWCGGRGGEIAAKNAHALEMFREMIRRGRQHEFRREEPDQLGRSRVRWRAQAPWVGAVQDFVAAGGRVVIADATPDEDAILDVFGVGVRYVHVADVDGTARCYVRAIGVRTPSSQRPTHKVVADVVRGFQLALNDRAAPASIGVVTHKEWLSELVAAIQGAFPGIPVRGLWYGGERGLDDLAACEALLCAGTFWISPASIGANPDTAEGVHAWNLAAQRAMIQAHGRARPVHGGPKLIVQIGEIAPDPCMAPQWAECRVLDLGRRPVSVCVSPRARLGLSDRELAEVFGVSARTVARDRRRSMIPQNPAENGGAAPHNIEEPRHTPQHPDVDPGAPVPLPADDPEAMVSEPMEDPTHTPIVDCDDPTSQPDYATVNPGAVDEYEDQLRRLAAEMAAGRGEEPLAAELREQMAVDWYTLSTPEQHRMDELSERLYAEEGIAIPLGGDDPDADEGGRAGSDPATEEEEDLPDPFDGANARPFTLPDPIRHPFPTVDLVGKCPLPQPPKLKKTMSELERVELMLRAMRAVFACRFPKSPTRHLFKNARDIRQSKFWPTLLAAADALLDDDISPHCWVDWSIEQFYEQKAAPPRDPNGQGPPWMWLLSVKRLTKQGNWYRATACTTGGMVLLSREAENVVDRYRIATARLPYEDEDDVFREVFPLGYFNECHGAKVETERIFAILKRLRDSWDVHLWARYEKDIRRIVAPEIERELWGG